MVSYNNGIKWPHVEKCKNSFEGGKHIIDATSETDWKLIKLNYRPSYLDKTFIENKIYGWKLILNSQNDLTSVAQVKYLNNPKLQSCADRSHMLCSVLTRNMVQVLPRPHVTLNRVWDRYGTASINRSNRHRFSYWLPSTDRSSAFSNRDLLPLSHTRNTTPLRD